MKVWERGILTQFDYTLFIGAVILALLGALGIYNASPESGDYSLFLRHLLWLSLGVGVCLFVMSVDYHFLADHAFLFYALSALLLIGIPVLWDGDQRQQELAHFRWSELSTLGVGQTDRDPSVGSVPG